MFRKSKIKIVILSMGVLVLLLAGTLGTIFLTSYLDVRSQDYEMLKRYAEEYARNGAPDMPEPELHEPDKAQINKPDERLPGEELSNRRFQISTFYSVAFDKNGEVIGVINDINPLYSDEELTEEAAALMNKGRGYGRSRNLAYLISEQESYTLVVMMDNTVIDDSISTLIHYILIFGTAAVVLLFFLSLFFADRIIHPLEENYRKQKQFISDAGHELKTPVSTIQANAELLYRELGENRWLSNIRFENRRMSEIVHQLLELAKAENVQSPMERTELGRIVTGGILPFEGIVFEQGMVIRDELQENVWVMGNPQQLKQLIAILMDNAVRHSKEGGTVRVMLRTVRGNAVLEVSNQGEDIPREQREKIFDRFYQIDSAHSEENHYGLGLAIAKAIVTSHHGRIGVDSQRGETIFTVILPQKHAGV